MATFTYYTQEGYDKLHAELHELKTKGRSHMSQQIAEARDKGDLSENAEYDAAKDAQGHLEAKISKLENLVSVARVIDQNAVDTSIVGVLTSVKIKNKKNNMEIVYTLVAENETDIAKNKISISSPIGQGLLGKSVGDIAEIKAPVGLLEFEIMDIFIS